MTNHIPREEISAWMDREVEPAVADRVRRHLEICASCRALQDEMAGITVLFQKMDVLEPSPYIWTRISANIGSPRTGSWRRLFGLESAAGRTFASRARTGALAAMLLLGCGIAAFYWSSVRTERRQLAEIERACRAFMPQGPESFNPFTASPWFDIQENPFTRSLDGAAPPRHR